MVESYYPGTVPNQCFDDSSNGLPKVTIRVDKAPSSTIASISYED